MVQIFETYHVWLFFTSQIAFGAHVRPGDQPPDPGQGRPEAKSVPHQLFLKLLEHVSGWGVGRQILAVRSPKGFQISYF